jgi:GTP-binding protein
MPQTRFVLRKALLAGHKAIVVVNKIDRPNARPEWVVNETFDLFVELGASDDQADFPVIFASAINGISGTDFNNLTDTLEPLFDAIVETIPAPDVDSDASAQMLVTNTFYDDYRGKIMMGRLRRGTLRKAQQVIRFAHDGTQTTAKIIQLFVYSGLNRTEVEEVQAGEIIALSGIADGMIGDTVADVLGAEQLPIIAVEEPTVRMTFGVNTSPLSAAKGRTSRRASFVTVCTLNVTVTWHCVSKTPMCQMRLWSVVVANCT